MFPSLLSHTPLKEHLYHTRVSVDSLYNYSLILSITFKYFQSASRAEVTKSNDCRLQNVSWEKRHFALEEKSKTTESWSDLPKTKWELKAEAVMCCNHSIIFVQSFPV